MSGAQCDPFFFVSSWPSETYSEAAGQYMTSKGIKNVLFLAPNYQGGKDSATGFKRYYKGKLVDEMYTKLGQLDYAAELSQIRAAKPEALYVFLPGGMGINFIKQFVAAGMSKDMQLVVPLWGSDQDIIRAVGEPMLGLFSVGHWSIDFDNPANKKFVAEFEREYKRLPTGYAASGYDTALLIDSAIRKVKGKIENKEALRAALRAADFKSVRGEFKFNRNQFPVQNYYLQVVGKGPDGRIMHKTLGTVLKDRGDAYVQDCKMK
jgi:branched-chain amino acid transport system substrate-binding protein